MAQATASPAEMIPQLEAARKLVLGDAHFYTQIIPGILPIIGPGALLEIRRWGAEFLAETFASPALGDTQKEELSFQVLPLLRGMLDTPAEDAAVVKSVVQTAASVYPFVFRRCISQPQEAAAWQNMAAVKSNILKRMDVSPLGIRLCCIKFVQRVVHVQTPGIIKDPRRPEQNETSIALVPRNHPCLSLPQLEAEASGLLDRLLDVFNQNLADPILIDSTLNCVGMLIRSRPAVANKIISAILNFNPMKQANAPMTPRIRVVVRSMERTTRALLKNINKNNPSGPLAAKIDAYLVRLNQSRAAVFQETPSLKRPAPSEPTDGLDDAKRQRLAAGPPRRYPHMPPPPNSFAQLFTLTEDQALMNFDAKLISVDMINPIAALLLQHVDNQALEDSIGAVRARYEHIRKMQQPTPIPDVPMAGPTGIDDEDDYDPEYDGDSLGLSAPAAAAQRLDELVQPDIELGPFELPKPPPLTEDDIKIISRQTRDRFLEVIDSSATGNQSHLSQRLGLNRLAASANDRDAWVTMLARLATRAPSQLEDSLPPDDETNGDSFTIKNEDSELTRTQRFLATDIREGLFRYVAQDFRSRLNTAISWLNEEWYNDKLAAKSDPALSHLPNYYAQTLIVLDYMVEFLDARDNKLLIRFLSEIPAISMDVLARVRAIAMDPERVNMCMMALQYLILMRPPARSMAIDTVEAIWRTNREARVAAAKVLGKWRPVVLEEGPVKKQEMSQGVKGEEMPAGVNGIKDEDGGLKPDMGDPRRRSATRTPSAAA